MKLMNKKLDAFNHYLLITQPVQIKKKRILIREFENKISWKFRN